MMDTSPDIAELSLDALGRIDKTCTKFEQRLKAGEYPGIESLVAIAAGEERRQLIKELLILELDYRHRNDNLLDPDSYVQAFPDDATLIQESIRQFESSDYYQYQRRQLRVEDLSKCDSATDFADYKILEEIDRGGMGIVYKARQNSLHRTVALKMILHGKLANEEEVHRFQKEAKAAGALNHSGIVAIHEIGVHQGQHYFSMEFVDGPSLQKLTADKPMRSRAAAALVLNIVNAMAHAHDYGVVHRDLKPSNILIDTNGDPRITDFGLAKDVSCDTLLTKTGQLMGYAVVHVAGTGIGARRSGRASQRHLLNRSHPVPGFDRPTTFQRQLTV